jgi:hypothetical protein
MYIASLSTGFDPFAAVAKDTLQAVACFPFDLARENYARSVRAGLVEQSMLASAKFGTTLCALETMTLGPLARSR